ncbi:pyridoxal phosphate-dependent transferase [Pestalotiopsis sp. NC0098]|nr:pyridoxal phosphate-dependent transferase [Pestalotiopsis sp. NC0098]
MGGQKSNDNGPIFGPSALEHFSFEPGYRNLNHGSFGATPLKVQERARHYQAQFEARPDVWFRYEAPKLLDENRAAAAELLNAPLDTIVLVANATVGTNTVLRNLEWSADGKDEILHFNTAYGACAKTIDYIVDSNGGRVASREIALSYPCEDSEVLDAFRGAVARCAAEGKRPKICVFDTVSSLPGVRFPFENMTKACKELGILSFVDGAQGIGQIEIDLTAIDPDFFVTNCHKWLHVPRSCAIFYVPVRNQHMITSTLPTSHGYVPKHGTRFNPLPSAGPGKSAFVHNFEYVGTLDTSAYLCVKDAIEWRKEVFGGEAAIIEYTQWLAAEGGRRAAEILGTTVMENKSGSLTKCTMVNVALPMWVKPGPDASSAALQEFAPQPGDIVFSLQEALAVDPWIKKVFMEEYNTFIPLYIHRHRVWFRLSAQVYLDVHDFEWAAKTVLEVVKRVANREYETK